MSKLVAGLVIVVALEAGFHAQALAQGLGPYDPSGPQPFGAVNRPNVSPYLNLLRGGDPAANYYLGVVPEFQRRAFVNRSIEDFQDLYKRQAQTRDLLDEQLAREPLIRTLPPTGHPTGFLSYGTYFNLNKR